MINTNDFRTKTEFIVRKNASANDTWGIALDIGYSAVKGFSPNSVFRFPAYARKLEGKRLEGVEYADTDIYYRDHEGTWAVGKCAQDMIASDDTRDSSMALYGRNRYYSPMFLVISRVGFALGLQNNSCGSPNNRKLVLQTGLPPAYMKTDDVYIKDVLSGTHTFDVKIGNNPWRTYSFELNSGAINIMPQPMGAFVSIATGNDGRPTADAQKCYAGNTLVVDPGFGTMDYFAIQNKIIKSTETFDNLGMREVLQRTANRIYKEYGVEVRVPAIQDILEKGKVSKFDRRTRVYEEFDIAKILEEESSKVCEEGLKQISDLYNDLLDFDYLIITGGTGEAWAEEIKKYFGCIKSLNIIDGNKNDEELSYVYANVRGYYMFLTGRLKKAEGK